MAQTHKRNLPGNHRHHAMFRAVHSEGPLFLIALLINEIYMSLQSKRATSTPSKQIRHSAVTRITHQPRILGQHTPRHRHIRRLPLLQPPINLFSTDIHINPILLRI
jgi:hypothetical protein